MADKIQTDFLVLVLTFDQILENDRVFDFAAAMAGSYSINYTDNTTAQKISSSSTVTPIIEPVPETEGLPTDLIVTYLFNTVLLLNVLLNGIGC